MGKSRTDAYQEALRKNKQDIQRQNRLTAEAKAEHERREEEARVRQENYDPNADTMRLLSKYLQPSLRYLVKDSHEQV